MEMSAFGQRKTLELEKKGISYIPLQKYHSLRVFIPFHWVSEIKTKKYEAHGL